VTVAVRNMRPTKPAAVRGDAVAGPLVAPAPGRGPIAAVGRSSVAVVMVSPLLRWLTL
jgi:hypothetical protein